MGRSTRQAGLRAAGRRRDGRQRGGVEQVAQHVRHYVCGAGRGHGGWCELSHALHTSVCRGVGFGLAAALTPTCGRQRRRRPAPRLPELGRRHLARLARLATARRPRLRPRRRGQAARGGQLRQRHAEGAGAHQRGRGQRRGAGRRRGARRAGLPPSLRRQRAPQPVRACRAGGRGGVSVHAEPGTCEQRTRQ
jgi:hypothetical protein